ncbi:hypothetical protein [Spiroplasma endosymbiont of Labia minor]|uniref:hypothetical protein n=1 Tax=Spiroplasma endosymbiont of Labia minor TaxID=3066305 RepID=UPI0030D3F8D9
MKKIGSIINGIWGVVLAILSIIFVVKFQDLYKDDGSFWAGFAIYLLLSVVIALFCFLHFFGANKVFGLIGVICSIVIVVVFIIQAWGTSWKFFYAWGAASTDDFLSGLASASHILTGVIFSVGTTIFFVNKN